MAAFLSVAMVVISCTTAKVVPTKVGKIGYDIQGIEPVRPVIKNDKFHRGDIDLFNENGDFRFHLDEMNFYGIQWQKEVSNGNYKYYKVHKIDTESEENNVQLQQIDKRGKVIGDENSDSGWLTINEFVHDIELQRLLIGKIGQQFHWLKPKVIEGPVANKGSVKPMLKEDGVDFSGIPVLDRSAVYDGLFNVDENLVLRVDELSRHNVLWRIDFVDVYTINARPNFKFDGIEKAAPARAHKEKTLRFVEVDASGKVTRPKVGTEVPVSYFAKLIEEGKVKVSKDGSKWYTLKAKGKSSKMRQPKKVPPLPDAPPPSYIGKRFKFTFNGEFPRIERHVARKANKDAVWILRQRKSKTGRTFALKIANGESEIFITPSEFYDWIRKGSIVEVDGKSPKIESFDKSENDLRNVQIKEDDEGILRVVGAPLITKGWADLSQHDENPSLWMIKDKLYKVMSSNKREIVFRLSDKDGNEPSMKTIDKEMTVKIAEFEKMITEKMARPYLHKEAVVGAHSPGTYIGKHFKFTFNEKYPELVKQLKEKGFDRNTVFELVRVSPNNYAFKHGDFRLPTTRKKFDEYYRDVAIRKFGGKIPKKHRQKSIPKIKALDEPQHPFFDKLKNIRVKEDGEGEVRVVGSRYVENWPPLEVNTKNPPFWIIDKQYWQVLSSNDNEVLFVHTDESGKRITKADGLSDQVRMKFEELEQKIRDNRAWAYEPSEKDLKDAKILYDDREDVYKVGGTPYVAAWPELDKSSKAGWSIDGKLYRMKSVSDKEIEFDQIDKYGIAYTTTYLTLKHAKFAEMIREGKVHPYGKFENPDNRVPKVGTQWKIYYYTSTKKGFQKRIGKKRTSKHNIFTLSSKHGNEFVFTKDKKRNDRSFRLTLEQFHHYLKKGGIEATVQNANALRDQFDAMEADYDDYAEYAGYDDDVDDAMNQMEKIKYLQSILRNIRRREGIF